MNIEVEFNPEEVFGLAIMRDLTPGEAQAAVRLLVNGAPCPLACYPASVQRFVASLRAAGPVRTKIFKPGDHDRVQAPGSGEKFNFALRRNHHENED